MPAPHNRFKAALKRRDLQIGCWLALANSYTAEAMAGAGFDWLVIDGEHAPNDLPRMLEQLQALKGGTADAVIRIPMGETWMIKQVLDIGCQNVLVPMVESGDQAHELARAMRYPPHGIRGVGSALARASGFGAVTDYLPSANAEACLIVQVESRRGLAAIEDIAAVDGVDGIFIGPSDLAADMGHLGKPSYPEVKAAVEDAIARIVAAGKPAGVLSFDRTMLESYIARGVSFAAVGADVALLTQAARALAASFRA
ncbi:MAG: aldolase/citrate lyase family protein [Devosia sp.]